MAQIWNMPPQGTDFAHEVLKGRIPDALESLRTCFSGATEPDQTVPYMLWADTGTGYLRVRNAADNAWVTVAPLAYELSVQLAAEGWAGTQSATRTDLLARCPRPGRVRRLVLVSGAATTSSSGNEWQFALTKLPASAPGSPVQLFSGTVGTFSALAGVGGGAEFVANGAYVLIPDQNDAVADLDVLEFTLTKVGTVANLTTFRASVDIQ